MHLHMPLPLKQSVGMEVLGHKKLIQLLAHYLGWYAGITNDAHVGGDSSTCLILLIDQQRYITDFHGL